MASKRRVTVVLAVTVLATARAGTASSSAAPATASAGVKKQVKKLKRQVRELKRQVGEVERLSGPQGAAGAPGARGPQGPTGPSTGPAGGDLSGSYPDPSIADGGGHHPQARRRGGRVAPGPGQLPDRRRHPRTLPRPRSGEGHRNQRLGLVLAEADVRGMPAGEDRGGGRRAANRRDLGSPSDVRTHVSFDSFPLPSDTGASFRGIEPNGRTTGSWGFEAYAICTWGSGSLFGP